MAWTLLPTNYTDAVWDGLKKYSEVNNPDGTVSFRDVTVYTNKEKSFFGAKDANRMNGALNHIMSMLENGTNLYEEFQTYFSEQKTLFRKEVSDVVENVRALSNAEYDSLKTYLAGLKAKGDKSLTDIETEYEKRMSTYESEQKALFDAWFADIKGQLSSDIAGSLQNQITEVDQRLGGLEYMTIHNDFTAPIALEGTGTILLTDDLGNAIVADWKYKEE